MVYSLLIINWVLLSLLEYGFFALGRIVPFDFVEFGVRFLVGWCLFLYTLGSRCDEGFSGIF